MARAMICVGDTTTHGGRVLEGSATATIDGKPIAGVGHKVLCPQCKGVFPILPATGRRYPHTFDGRETAIEGMNTACGATLIASQSSATLDDVGSGEATTGGSVSAVAATAAALAPSPTLCLECLKAAAENAATMIARG
ncbi:PAAR domain-containing protein [Burkholderia pyrrocinia]|uniref:PAAR domain-containing protein n=1 Tax=Burkholderia pyrrocinia TaxID=60550 RepID=UPI0015758CC1|nr:PAAR domain-containing protein [Burkholderia pyrrocinia]NTX28682.1 PAAR domain-containing protein [Burkholderia pyrrocinia]